MGRTRIDKTTALKDVAYVNEQIDHYRHQLGLTVKIAREQGASWAEIGDVLGVSRQAAQERFGK